MDIERCYTILQVGKGSTSEEITRSFRAMALKYHPDKNPQRREWANEQMTTLNMAYSTLMSFRFRQENGESGAEKPASHSAQKPSGREGQNRAEQEKKFRDELHGLRDEARRDYLINGFVRSRESAKDGMYRYFQYGLYNFHRREERKNLKIYNDMVLLLRRTYHSIRKLSSMTDDPELIEHFDVFSRMIFNFYRASECLNLIDSYRDSYEVDSYRLYKKGDESLHLSHKEIFFDRHNRGYFIRERTVPPLIEAEGLFKRNLKLYSDSSWAVEAGIKLEYVLSLKAYITLFFTEE
jgi:curved DNA-binding protein CbpA